MMGCASITPIFDDKNEKEAIDRLQKNFSPELIKKLEQDIDTLTDYETRFNFGHLKELMENFMK